MYPTVHKKISQSTSFDRLDMLWEKYPQFHEMTTFTTLEDLLEEHEHYQTDLDDALKEEYVEKGYDRFLVQLSWADLPYRQATRKLIDAVLAGVPSSAAAQVIPGDLEHANASAPSAVQSSANASDPSAVQSSANASATPGVPSSAAAASPASAPRQSVSAKISITDRHPILQRLFPPNPYVEAFVSQFVDIDTDRKAVFLFPESCVTQFFVIMEVCKRAERLRPIRSLFPDEEKIHYLAVFDKQNMDDVLLMYHLLYNNTSEDLYGGYSLYDYSLPWYQTHLWEEGVVLRSPFLPDRMAKFQGNLPYYHNPVKTVYVRRNIEHMLECGYFGSELELFLNLTLVVMPMLHWWFMDLNMYEEKDGLHTNWRLERTRIRTDLTAEGVIKPKWKHELSLFHLVRAKYPDTLYQYRPDWLGRQSLDLYIPSLETAIEYQGVQHYRSVDFFGGEEALAQRQELDQIKKEKCLENHVRLIEWPYDCEPSLTNLKEILS